MAAKIEKTTIIGDVLDIAPETAPLFMAIGMHCLGCPSSRGETVEEACMVHGVDADAFLAQVNRFIEASEEANRLSNSMLRKEAAAARPPFCSERRAYEDTDFQTAAAAARPWCRRARAWPTSARTTAIWPYTCCATGVCPFVTAADLREQPLQKAQGERRAASAWRTGCSSVLSDGLQSIAAGRGRDHRHAPGWAAI